MKTFTPINVSYDTHLYDKNEMINKYEQIINYVDNNINEIRLVNISPLYFNKDLCLFDKTILNFISGELPKCESLITVSEIIHHPKSCEEVQKNSETDYLLTDDYSITLFILYLLKKKGLNYYFNYYYGLVKYNEYMFKLMKQLNI
jgi:hypothetical protein